MDSEMLLRYLLISLISIAIAAYIFSLFFNASKILKHNRAQTSLLMKIAKQQGVSEEEIKKIEELLN